MKALPPADPFKVNMEEYFKFNSEILDMCANPSKKYDEVVLVRDIGISGYVKGSKGIARPFNSVDIYNLCQDYHRSLKSDGRLRNLSENFDFFPIVEHKGRMIVSMFHARITRFDFRIIKRKKAQLEIKF